MKKILTTIISVILIFSTIFSTTYADELTDYKNMAKANANAVKYEKKDQLNTRYDYTGIQVAEQAVKLGFKRYFSSDFKYYNGENLEIRELPTNGQTKALHLEVSSVAHDMSVYMPNPDNYIKGKFKQLCGLILPKSGDKLYNKILNTKQKQYKFNMDGRTFTVCYIGDKYDIFISPYAIGTVKVDKTKTYTGPTILSKLYPIGFYASSKIAGTAIWNSYGKTGDITFDIASFSTGSGQYDIVMCIYQSNPAIDKEYKKILNWILPKSGNTLYNILDTPNLPKLKTVYLDGRRIDIEVYGFGLILLFSPIYS